MPSYIGKLVNLPLDPMKLPLGGVTIPQNYFGLHHGSFGAGGVFPSIEASGVCTLVNGQPVVTMTNQGNGYYNESHLWCAVIFEGGGATVQAIGTPLLNSSGNRGINGVKIVKPGIGYTSAPTVRFVTVGAPNIPPIGCEFNSYRTHDYRGNLNSSVTRWSYIDQGTGEYRWQYLDEIVTLHHALGKKIVYTLYSTPTAYAQYPTIRGPLYDPNNLGASSAPTEAGYVALSTFVELLITRYNVNAHLLTNPITGLPFDQGTKLLDAIEVWNEPLFGVGGATGAPIEGKYWIGSAQELSEIIRITSTTAKSIDPSITIVGCGFIAGYPMTVPSSPSQYTHFYNLLMAVNPTSGLLTHTYFDDVSIHLYDGLEPRSQSRGLDQFNWQVVLDATFATLAAINFPGNLWVTEIGYLSSTSRFSQADGQTKAKQLKRIFAYMALRGVRRTFLYSYDSKYSGGAMTDSNIIQALTEINSIGGKHILAAKSRFDGAIQLSFSDGTVWFSD